MASPARAPAPPGMVEPAVDARTVARSGLKRRRRVLPLRVIVPLTSAILLAFAVLGSWTISERNARSLLVRELETRLVLEARNLALTGQGALLDAFPELTLQPLIREIRTARPELAFVLVIDPRGRVRGQQDARNLGKPFRAPPGLALTATATPLGRGERLLANRSLLVAEVPVFHRGKIIGTAIVGMRRATLESRIHEGRRGQFFLLLLVLTVGGLATLVFVSLLLKPVTHLRQGMERIGRGDLGTRLAVEDHSELRMLAESVNQMAERLEVAQGEALERQRLSSEMELARRIQSSILPAKPMICGDFVIAGRHRAAAEVGGDYYDLLPLPDGRVGIAIADVSGKGIAGCLVMSMMCAVLRTLRNAYGSPAELLVALDRSLSGSMARGSFVTMTYGILDPTNGHLVYASAGHLPPLYYRARSDTLEWRRSRSIPIGAVRGGALARLVRDEEITLEPGDLWIQLTDGYTEAEEPKSGEPLGFERIEAVVREHVEHGPDQVIEALADTVSRWTGQDAPKDDETLLVVCRAGGAARDSSRAARASDQDPLALLERAQNEGRALSLESVFELAPQLPAWLAACPDIGWLEEPVLSLVESALYEACTNILEHGYRGAHTSGVEIWWLPAPNWHAAIERLAAAVDREELHRRIGEGRFVIVDRGAAFDPESQPVLDLSDPAMRRRGRGLGLAMIRRIMAEVTYRAGTQEGNITVMRFDPDRIDVSEREELHG